ncbi:MAG: VWA domain-containing protein [Planctomycetaceae bacterium]|nr:VWA domain-containing protein [Planctomycetaceae bacterium]
MQFRGVPLSKYVPAALSVVVHVAFLCVAAAWTMAIDVAPESIAVESVFDAERVQEEFSQAVAMDTSISSTLSVTTGGGSGGGGGGGGGGGSPDGAIAGASLGASSGTSVPGVKVQRAVGNVVSGPRMRISSIGDLQSEGLQSLGMDLGEGEVSGEIGARAENYGVAMHRLTQEIIRMMREQPVIAVWLFDGTLSLRDDRAEISDNFNKIYEELNIAGQQADQRGRDKQAPLDTMVCSFGSEVRKITSKPTSDLKEIQSAIGRIDDDNSGVERLYAAISGVIDDFGVPAQRSHRKLVIIVVTDESGDDEELLEEVVEKSRQYKAPVYLLAREAIFGYRYARQLWIDPETQLHFWPRISRGPESAFAECLQYDGFHDRSWEATSSGFGPYSQIRLVKESGGIFFQLSRDETELIGWGARTPRKFDDIAMKEYEPLLVDRREYVRQRDASPFRKTLWEVVATLNPENDPDLSLARHGYPMDKAAFVEFARGQFERTLRAMHLLKEAVDRLETVKEQREQERDQRWRAAFDLAYAQCLAYRVRLFQLLLAIDRHVVVDEKPARPISNHWDVAHVQELLEPSEQQIKATKVDLAELESERERAAAAYQFVIDTHPSTPWALRAQMEMAGGFGVKFVDDFEDPRYGDANVRSRVPEQL